MARRLRIGFLAGSSLLAVTAAAPTVAPGQQPDNRIECTYTAAPTRTVTFVTGESDRELVLERAGDEIRMASSHFFAGPRKGKKPNLVERVSYAACPVTPTVANVDAVQVVIDHDSDMDLEVSLEGGAFAPGFTPEADGSSEIEIAVSVGDGGQVISFAGDAGPNWLRFGLQADGALGANMNAEAEAAAPDVDATLRIVPAGDEPDPDAGRSWPIAAASGLAGDDQITSTGGQEFASAVPRSLFATGGGGNDTIVAAPNPDYNLLQGGPGNDIVNGAGAYNVVKLGAGDDTYSGVGRKDAVDLGRGRDTVFTGARHDFVLATDGARDAVRCGAGRDVAATDKKDRRAGCEVESDLKGKIDPSTG